MAFRERVFIDFIWVHINLTVPPAISFRDIARVFHVARGSFLLSVTENILRTEALVKIAGARNLRALGLAENASVIRVFTEVDHDEAVSLISGPEWNPDALTATVLARR